MELQLKHSGLGIASLVISGVAVLLMLVAVIMIGLIMASTGGELDEESGPTLIAGFFVLLSIAATLVALGLGVGGLFQKQRKNTLAVVGTALAAFIIVGALVATWLCMQ